MLAHCPDPNWKMMQAKYKIKHSTKKIQQQKALSTQMCCKWIITIINLNYRTFLNNLTKCFIKTDKNRMRGHEHREGKDNTMNRSNK